jgi:hypothetical protein
MRFLIVIAFVNTPLIALGATVMVHDVYHFGWGSEVELFFLAPMAVLALMLLSILARRRVSRWQRAVVVVVMVQTFLLPVTSYLLSGLGRWLKIELSKVPSTAALLLTFAMLGVMAMWSAKGRREVPRLLRMLTAFTMTYSLAFAFLLPVVVHLTLDPLAERESEFPHAMLLIGALPPAVAVAYWVGYVEKQLQPLARNGLVGVVVVVLLIDCLITPRMGESRWYGMLIGIHTLLALFSVATTSMCALAFAQWWLLRGVGEAPVVNPPSVMIGTVVGKKEEEEVGWFRYLGMLRGMRTELAAFMFKPQDEDRELAIPAGTPFVAALPVEALDPKPGEKIAALKHGDTIIVRGFSGGVGEKTFREHAGVVVGPRGLHVMRVDEALLETNARQEAVLAVWRPFLIGVSIATAGSLPIVIAVLRGLLRWVFR